MRLQRAMPNVQHHHSLSAYSHQAASSKRSPYPAPSEDGVPTQTGLWSSLAHRPSSHMSKVRSFDCFRSFHGDLAAHSSDSCTCHGELVARSAASSSSSAIQVAGRHHRDREQEVLQDRAFMQRLSAPVDVVRPCQWRSCREERRKAGGSERRGRRSKDEEEEAPAEDMVTREEEDDDGEEEEEEEREEEEEEEEERLPPHEELAREWAAATSCGGAAFSLCQGVGRTLKGRDLCRVRNAILKQTGFIS